MKDIVYLLNAYGTNRYKIGVTNSNKLNQRIQQIQTGCPDELHLFLSFNTKYATILEKQLHRCFKDKHTTGEWFELTDEDVLTFQSKCVSFHEKYKILEEHNIFFKKRIEKK